LAHGPNAAQSGKTRRRTGYLEVEGTPDDAPEDRIPVVEDRIPVVEGIPNEFPMMQSTVNTVNLTPPSAPESVTELGFKSQK